MRAGGVQQLAAGAIGIQNSPGAQIGYTPAQHEAALKDREASLRADLGRAHTAEKALILRELDEVRRQRADLETSYRDKVAELEEAKAALERLANQVPRGRLEAAFRALDRGDTAEADTLFAEVQAGAATAIDAAATAAFERGSWPRPTSAGLMPHGTTPTAPGWRRATATSARRARWPGAPATTASRCATARTF